jgi:spore maturation protein A
MLNIIWLGMIGVSIVCAFFTGRVDALVQAVNQDAQQAFHIVINLIGILCFWLGLMRIAEKAGLVHDFSRLMRPVLRWLFPEVPADHPAMGEILFNISANMLGLNNAATPFGLRAMQALDQLNTRKGVATDAMCTLLAINTSSVQLIPATAMAFLAAAGAHNPADILISSLLATSCSTIVALFAVTRLRRLKRFAFKGSA